MKVFIEASGRCVEPFGDPANESPIGNRPLKEWLADAIRDAGLTPTPTLEPPCLVVPDNLFCTGGALKTFVTRAAGRDAVLVLATSRFGRFTTPVQPGVARVDDGWRFSSIRFVSGQGNQPVDVVVEPNEKPFDVPVRNAYLGVDAMEFSIAADPIMTVHHWVHILWANQVYGGIDLLKTSRFKLAMRGLWAVIRAFSFNHWKVMGKLNTIGRNCDIHPTAIVECSTIGDGVRIGPFARVLLSDLADGAEVMSGANVEFCTVGRNAIISENSVIRFSTLYEESVASQYLMQQCVLGKRAVTTSGAYSMDLNFDAEIRVPLDGELHSTGQKFLGSAFGHDCRVGTGFWMASGRMIPNGYFVIRNPDDVLSRLNDGLDARFPIAVKGKGLVSLAPPQSESVSGAGAAEVGTVPSTFNEGDV